MSQISGSRSNPIKTSMLRPSTLQMSSSAEASSPVSKTSVLRPAVFKVGNTDEAIPPLKETTSTSNPFLLHSPNDDAPVSKSEENVGSDNKKEDKTDTMSLLSKNGCLSKSNLFATTKTSIPISENTGFVFGENVHERVTGESVQNTEVTKSENDCSNQSNSSGELFAIAGNKNSDTSIPVEASVESLTEVARVYEESRAQKRKYEEVETFTGEEDETNVLDVNSKLFTFVASNWEERGPGSLRVNDSKDKTKSSRVVFRTSGNLRVLLNTKVWPGMVVERPSQKSLRLTAIDSAGQIKIFLAMARPDDITNLYTALNKRIEFEKSRVIEADSSDSESSPKKPALAELDDDSTDS